jgi:hypothetical protein
MWSLKACDIRVAKKDGHAMESRSCLSCASFPLACVWVDGRRLSPPPWVVCTIA